MKKLSLLFLLAILTQSINAQQLAPSIIWQKCLGGSGEDRASSILRTVDNGYLIGGYSKSNNGDVTGHHGSLDSSDAWIAQISSLGDLLWQKSIGGSGTDVINQLIHTTDGNYLAIGTTTSNNGDVFGNHGKSDFWVIKLNRQGDLLWQKCFGGSGDENPRSVKPTPDGGYIIIGSTTSINGDVSGHYGSSGNDIWLIKLSNQGVLEWQKCLGGSEEDNGYDVVSLANNEYLLGVATNSQSGDFEGTGGNGPVSFILKINSQGVVLQRSFVSQRASAYSIKSLSDGNYILLNNLLNCYPMNPNTATAINRLSPALNVSLSTEYSHCGSVSDNSYSYYTIGPDNLFPLSNDQSIISMSTNHPTTANRNYHGLFDGLISKFGLNGNISWQKCYGGSQNDYFAAITSDDQYTFVACGYTYSNDGDVTGNHGGGDFWVVKVGQTNLIKGSVFADYNVNSIKDNDEPFINNIIVESQKGNTKSASSTYNGIFSNSVDTGAYSTQVLTPVQYYTPIPVSKTSTFTTYNTFDSILFALQPIPGKRDYQINVLPAPFLRPGFKENYLIQFVNRGTDTLVNKNVTFIIDGRLNFISAVPIQSSVSGDTIRWSVPILLPREAKSISVEFEASVPPSLNIHDTVAVIALIDSIGDLSPSDNASIVKQAVTGAYDPNDKQENRSGSISTREIQDNNYLIYTIRFQNTGNDTAFNVSIKDTLRDNVELSSLEMITASHPYKMEITGGNKINWTFKDIKLVDSLHNEPESHGFVSYRVKPKSNLAAGAIINNSASIYFDFNPPIKTNDHITTIKDPSLDKPEIANLKPSYCKNITANQEGRIINMPSDNTTISATLDGALLNLTGNRFAFNVSGLSTGNHTILVSFSNGQETQTSSFVFSVTEPALPQVKLITNVSSVSSVSVPVIITATNVSGGGSSPSYLFSKERDFSTSIQSESTNNILNISASSLELGANWIYAKMKTSETCYSNQFSTDSVRIDRNKTSGLIDEDYPDQVINVYPNPIKQSININGLRTEKNYTIIIYNALGKEIYKKTYNNSHSISIIKGDLQNGKYILSIYDSRRKKLIGTISLVKL